MNWSDRVGSGQYFVCDRRVGSEIWQVTSGHKNGPMDICEWQNRHGERSAHHYNRV